MNLFFICDFYLNFLLFFLLLFYIAINKLSILDLFWDSINFSIVLTLSPFFSSFF